MAADAAENAEREQRLSQVLGAYFEALEAGQAPDRQALIAQHPDLAAELSDFFAQQEQFDRLVQPLRASGSSLHAIAQPAAGAEIPTLLLENPGATASVWGEGYPALPIRVGGDSSFARPGTRLRYFGDYELLEEIGCGGMGVVFKARQRSLNRLVAVKMIRAGHWASEDDVRRFRNEAEAVANLDHHHIVPIYEVGAHEGRHYFSMKLIEGQSLAQRLREYADDPRTCARLLREVALAVHHAHQRGILHRDLKPSNILIDAAGQPHVTDFGLAKRVTGEAELSQSGSIVGTPAYMAPEQAAGRKGGITTATDVYGLGAVLYTMLAGRPPFQGGSMLEVLMQVKDSAPEPPSVSNRRLDRDLETVCMKCLDHEPKRRYASAEALAADLERWLNNEPIEARPVGPAERFWRWCQRNAVVACLAFAVVTLLIVVTAISTASAVRYNRLAVREHDAAKRERQAHREAEARGEENRWRLVRMNIANGVRLMDRGDVLESLAWFAEAFALDQNNRAAERMHRYRIAAVTRACPALLGVWSHGDTVNSAEFSRDGKGVVTASDDGTARVWDAATGAPLTPPLRHDGPVVAASFSPDGRLVITASEDGTAGLWDAGTGTLHVRLKHGGQLHRAAFSPDGRLAVTASTNGVARMWETATGAPHGRAMRHGGKLWDAAFSPDGRLVATASDTGTVRFWSADSGEPTPARPLRHESLVRRVNFSPDGRRIVTASSDGTARVWDVASGNAVTPPLKQDLWIFHAEFSPDGAWVLTASHDGSARVWDARTGRPVSKPMRHKVAVRHAAFSPDGLRVVTAGWDGLAVAWDAASGDSLTPALTHGDKLMHVAFSPDGHRILASGCDRTTHLWELAGTGLASVTVDHGSGLNDAAFTPDGRRFATAAGDGTARIWDASNGLQVVPDMKHTRGVLGVVFSPDGRLVGTCSFDGTARVWDAATGKPVTMPLEHRATVRRVVFSPDGRLVATASEDGTARVWDARTGRPVTDPLRHKGAVWTLAFSPDGRRLATASLDATVRVWNPHTGEAVLPPLKHAAGVKSLAFSPDGRRLLTGCTDDLLSAREAQMWDVATGQPTAPPLRHGDGVECVSFSADGLRVVTCSEDMTARVWDAATSRPLTPPIVHGHTVARAWFANDGQRIVTGCWGDGTARVWDAATGEPLTPPLRQGGHLRVASFSPDCRRVLTAGDNGLAHIWELPDDTHPASDLLLRARLLASHRIDNTGGLVPLGPSEARDGWERLRLSHPDDTLPPPVSALIAWYSREAERAERQAHWFASAWNLERLLALEPDDAMAFSRLGRARAHLHDWDAARAAFTRAIAKGPAAAEIYVWRGWMSIHLNQPDRAINDFDRALKHSPQDATAWLSCFFAHGERSEWNEAEADWNKVVRFRNTPPVQRWRDLAGLLSDAISDGHDGWWAWRARAVVRECLDQWQDAASDYHEAINRKPDDWKSWSGRAWTLRKLDRLKESVDCYTRALELNPGVAHVRGMRGDTNAIMGRWKEAASDFAKWAELGGEDNAIPWHHHACLRLFVDDHEGYQKACRVLLDRYGASTDMQTLELVTRTCVLHADSGASPEQLVALAEKALAANPRKGSALFLLGAAHVRAGQWDEAVRRLQESVELDAGWRATHLSAPLLALAFDRLGNRARARQWLDQTDRWFDEVTQQMAHSESGGPPGSWYVWIEFEALRKELEPLREKLSTSRQERR